MSFMSLILYDNDGADDDDHDDDHDSRSCGPLPTECHMLALACQST